MDRILVTGATGHIGMRLVELLASRGAQVRALARSADKGRTLSRWTDDIAVGDLLNVETILRAFEGVSHAFLLSPPGPDQAQSDASLLQGARSVKLRHAVKISSIHAKLDSPIGFARRHAEAEKSLEEAGVPCTVLCAHTFMETILNSKETIQQGAFFGAFEQPVPMIATEDIARVAAVVLTTKGHEGKRYHLTGPESLTYAQVAETLASVLGRPVNYIQSTPDAAREAMVTFGHMPAWLADDLREMFKVIQQGRASEVSPVVAQLTGTTGTRLADFLKLHVEQLSS